mmetsp:Transcript_23017/g.52219  ORF Transcript_23017/g.52219 Transcript_23017/m.52219 type:complete len:103 (-) Transcript_23017:73-381(-)
MVRAEEDWFRSRLQMRVEMATEEAAMGTHDTLQASSEDDSACAASEDDDDSGPGLAYDHVAEELSQEFSQRSIGSKAAAVAETAEVSHGALTVPQQSSVISH